MARREAPPLPAMRAVKVGLGGPDEGRITPTCARTTGEKGAAVLGSGGSGGVTMRYDTGCRDCSSMQGERDREGGASGIDGLVCVCVCVCVCVHRIHLARLATRGAGDAKSRDARTVALGTARRTAK